MTYSQLENELLHHAPNLKEPCSCGSGRKYKNCCRKIGK